MAVPKATCAPMERLLARLRFRHLQLLAAIDAGGSLRAAAQELSLTQPAMSKSLRELEEMLGVVLFFRTRRGLQATPPGEAVIRGARLLIEELSHVRAEAEAAGMEGPAAIVRIGMPRFLAVTTLAELVHHLVTRDPPLRLQVREATAAQLLEDLDAGRVDALLTMASARLMSLLAGRAYHFERLAYDVFSVIAHPSHPLARKRALRWEDLAQERWIVPAEPSLNRQMLEQCFLGAGLTPPLPAIESDSPVTNVRLVARGFGLALVPGVVMREARAAGAVCRLAVRPELPVTSIVFVCRSSALAHPRIEAVREALGRMRDAGAWHQPGSGPEAGES